MAKMYGLYLGIITALVLCKHCLAGSNATESTTANGTVTPCRNHGNTDNCTDWTDAGEWNSHLSKCPEELKHYCVHGDCRYVKEQETPSCRCHQGFIGSRCEYVHLDWQIAEQRKIIVIGIIVGLIFFILFIVFLCMCTRRRWRPCWQRKRRRREPQNGTEKLGMMDAGATHAAVTLDARETPHTDSV